MVETSRYERTAAEVEGTPTGGPGLGANWTADLRQADAGKDGRAGHDLLGVPERASCGRMCQRKALGMTEPLIESDEIVALLFNVADIAVAAYSIEQFLRGEDDCKEEADGG
jgi:hypothetical protein